METIEVSTGSRQAFHDITSQLQAAVQHSGVQEGVCFIFCPHTTAGLTFNEDWDATVRQDLEVGLDLISPARPEYCHEEGNSPAHLKSTLVGASLFVPIVGGKLALGMWQGIFLVEFDGPRRRTVLAKAMAG